MKTLEDCNYVVRWYLAPILKMIELSDKEVNWYWARMLIKTKEEHKNAL